MATIGHHVQTIAEAWAYLRGAVGPVAIEDIPVAVVTTLSGDLPAIRMDPRQVLGNAISTMNPATRPARETFISGPDHLDTFERYARLTVRALLASEEGVSRSSVIPEEALDLFRTWFLQRIMWYSTATGQFHFITPNHEVRLLPQLLKF